jgi:hypothetical protein
MRSPPQGSKVYQVTAEDANVRFPIGVKVEESLDRRRVLSVSMQVETGQKLGIFHLVMVWNHF